MRNKHLTHTRPLAVAAVTVLLVTGIAAVQQAPPGIAYIESELILPQMPGYAQADSAFQADVESYTAEVEQLLAVLDSAVAAYQQQEPMLSPTVRQQRQGELQTMQQQAFTRRDELQQRAQTRNQELLAPFENRIQTIIDGIRAERNLGIILNVSTPGNQVVSADPSLNLTSIVIQRITTSGP